MLNITASLLFSLFSLFSFWAPLTPLTGPLQGRGLFLQSFFDDFDDPLFRQLKEMTDRLRQEDEQFDKMIQQLKKSFSDLEDFPPFGELMDRDKGEKFLTLKEGVAFVLPFELKESDSLDISTKGDHITLKIQKKEGKKRGQRAYKYNFSLPEGTDPAHLFLKTFEGKEGAKRTYLIFPWAKKKRGHLRQRERDFHPLPPSKEERRI